MGVQMFKGAAKQRARLVGRLNKLQAQMVKDLAEIEELKAKITAYNLVLQEQRIEVDPEDVFPSRAPTPRTGFFKHGELSALILEALRKAERPLSTVEVLHYVATELDITFPSHDVRYKARKGVKCQLNVYARKGIVDKLSENNTGGNNIPNVWALPEFAHLPHPLLEGQG